MNLSAGPFSSTGGVALARQAGLIATRLQFTLANGERGLGAYLATLRHYGTSATFSISGVLLGRHGDLVRYLGDRGVEFVVQGYVDIDLTRLSDSQQREHLAKALQVFATAGVPTSGFRAPYLRFNQGTLAAVEHLGFDYVSNETVFYDVLDEEDYPSSRRTGFRGALDRCAAVPATDTVVRPRMRGRLVEIPVALPDDQLLINRLGIVDGQMIGRAWAKLVDVSYQRGDILTLQVHPDRGAVSRQALAITLTAALEKSPPIWVAQLRDVAAWWRLRDRCRLKVEPAGARQWRVTGADDPRVTILVKNVICPRAVAWDDQYRAVEGPSCLVEGPVSPVVGVSSRSDGLAAFLLEEGYAIQVGDDPANCSVYLDHPGSPTPAEQAAIVDEIEASPTPLVRLARWPDGARSALAITGSIGALSLRDVVSRLWEVS